MKNMIKNIMRNTSKDTMENTIKKGLVMVCIMALLIHVTVPAYAAAEKDTKAPAVTKTSPADKTADIMRESRIVIRFSEKIKKGKTINEISIKTATAKAVAYTCEIENNLLILTPKKELAYLMDYTVSIPAAAVKDSAGNALKKAYTFHFMTEEDPAKKKEASEEENKYSIGLEAALPGEFAPSMQIYLIQYLKMFGIDAKITEVKKMD